MYADVGAQVLSGPFDLLCPIVPASCILTVDPIGDAVNPFAGFWDAFFVSSPEESLATAYVAVNSAPKPNFDSSWFRTIYQSEIAFYGVGISIIVLMVTLLLAFNTNRNHTFAGKAFIEWVSTIIQIIYTPVVASLIVLCSSILGESMFGSFGINDAEDYVGLVNINFFEVGFYSIFTRSICFVLTFEVFAFYVLQTVATLSAGIIVPLRLLGYIGMSWYVAMWRGILFGFAAFIMQLCMAGSALVASKADSGSESSEYLVLVAVLVGLVLAVLVPIKMSRSKRVNAFVVSMAGRLSETRITSKDFSLSTRTSDPDFDRYYEAKKSRRRERRHEIGNVLVDGAVVTTAAATGGATAALTAVAGAKSNKINKVRSAFDKANQSKERLNTALNKKEV